MSDTTFAFLAAYRGATLRFDLPAEEAEARVRLLRAQFDSMMPAGGDQEVVRSSAREYLRTAFLDGHQLKAASSSKMADTVVYLSLTSRSYAPETGIVGFIILITDKVGAEANFRFMMASDVAAVDQAMAEIRKDAKFTAAFTPEQVEKATKRSPKQRDPSLEPPEKPRPERWVEAVEQAERLLGQESLIPVHQCLEHGACFVWRSRQVEDASQEDVTSSLEAMAEHDRLHLPMPILWAETRDWVELPRDDGPHARLPARLAIAAQEQDGVIQAWGFADVSNERTFSLISAKMSVAAGEASFRLIRPPVSGNQFEESQHRGIMLGCTERLLELLFLLSASGVARDVVRVGGKSSGKAAKRKAAQRRMSEREYTIIRVPLIFQPGEGEGEGASSGGGKTGRWVRPHARRAHMWGKNVRPPEEQHWRAACLVGARKDEAPDIKRPVYRVG